MKKLMILLVFLFSIVPMFSLDVDSCITASYAHGIVNTKSADGTSNIIAPGFDLSIASYFNKTNVGFYLNTGYFFPNKISATVNNISATTTRSDYDLTSILSAMLGGTYRWQINKFDISVALGMHFAQTALRTKYVGAIDYSFGLGSDVGVRYHALKHLYLTAGGLLTYDFYSTGTINTAYGSKDVSGSINSIGFAPYIGLGIKYGINYK